MASIFCIFISALVFIFADKLMLIFIESSKSEIIYQGAQYLRIEGACYLGIGCLFLLYGYYLSLIHIYIFRPMLELDTECYELNNMSETVCFTFLFC